MPPVIVLTTVAPAFDAAAFARDLVETHLAACVNIVERIRSIYRWKNRVEEEAEQLLIIKTTDERLDELKSAVMAKHPYEVPEFIVVEIDKVEGPYLEWLLSGVRRP